MVEISKQHGMKMFKENDEVHLEAMHKMRQLMQDPQVMQQWFLDKETQFNGLPHKN